MNSTDAERFVVVFRRFHEDQEHPEADLQSAWDFATALTRCGAGRPSEIREGDRTLYALTRCSPGSGSLVPVVDGVPSPEELRRNGKISDTRALPVRDSAGSWVQPL